MTSDLSSPFTLKHEVNEELIKLNFQLELKNEETKKLKLELEILKINSQLGLQNTQLEKTQVALQKQYSHLNFINFSLDL